MRTIRGRRQRTPGRGGRADRRGLSLGISAALVVALVPAMAAVDAATTTDAASALTVTVPATENVQVQMNGHAGYSAAAPGGTALPVAGDDYRYGSAGNGTTAGAIGNPGGSPGTAGNVYADGSTAYVSSGTTAWTAHGNIAGAGGDLDLSNQSALGFAPASIASFETGSIFNLGRMVHSNNPVSVGHQFFQGDMDIRFMGMSLAYRWQMDETPNNCTGAGCADDFVTFLNQISSQTFTGPDGLTYTLTVRGLTAPQGQNNSCAAVVPSVDDVVNEFRTVERTNTYGCLYASVDQVRPLEVRKIVDSPYGTAPTRDFTFTRSSTLAGSMWSGPNFTLADGGSRTHNYTSSETVVIEETAQTDPWAFTSVSCVDGLGTVVGVVSGRQLTIPAGTTATTPAAQKITCTYTNTYTPRATLTLRKTAITVGQPAPIASAYNWTLSATGSGPVAGQAISGRGQSGQTDATATPAITNQSVIAGTYALAETPDGTRTAGYVQDGAWSCVQTGGTTPVPVTGGSVSLVDGANVTCTVTNRFQTGSIAITKTVTSSPAGGYTQGTGQAFTAQYSCAYGAATITGTVAVRPSATNGQAGSAVAVAGLPAGATCTISELSPPTGSTGLTDSSWTWGTPVVGPPATVTVPVGTTATVNITNPVTRQYGALQITKAIVPTAGTPASGYTGGSARTFPVTYSCSIGATVVASGTTTISTGAAATIPNIPATAVCRVSDETLSPASGDFADASYRWDGYSVAPATVTVPVGGTATLGVTNRFTRDLVPLTLAKVVTGNGYAGTGEPFTVDFACGTVSGSVTLGAGGSESVQVPAGVQCTVSEQAPDAALLAAGYVWGTPTYTGLTNGAVTVPRDGSATVTVTNPNTIGYGRIQVTKAIANFGDQVSSGTTFNVTVSCTAPAQGETANFTRVYTLTWSSDLTVTTPYLPVGTSCTVAETAAPSGSAALPDASYAWRVPPAVQTVDVPQSTTPAAVTVTNDIDRVTAPLAITKTVVNDTGAAVTTGFSGTWSCTYGGVTSGSGTWTAPPGGGPATLTPAADVLVGSVCAVTEAAVDGPVPGDGSYTWTVGTPADVTVPVDGATSIVTNTLNRATGSFNVSKSVDGGVAGEAFTDAPFPFTYTCTPLSGAPIAGSLEVAVDGSAAPAESIPGGSTCTVSEGSAPAAIDPYTWDGVTLAVTGAASSQPQSGRSITFVTPLDGATVSVAATNTISTKTVPVSVTKHVEDPDGGFVAGTEAIFTVTLVCDGVTFPTRQIADGGTTVWTDVPLGAECAASEQSVTGGLADDSFAWGAPRITPTSQELSDVDGDYAFTVVNPVVRRYAELSLVKIVDDGGFTGVVDPSRVYAGAWSCTYGGEIIADGEWSGTGSATGVVATLTGDTGDILRTAVCTATENALDPPSATDPSYVWLDPAITTITVGAVAADNTITVTNTMDRDTGAVTVIKTLSGAVEGFAPDDGFAGFPIGISCRLGDAVIENEVNVTAGADAVTLLDAVPYGWTCTVNEGSVTGQLRDSSFRWAGTTYQVDGEATGSFTVDGTHAVAVDNEIERVYGELQVTKAIDGAVPDGVIDPAQTFSGAYTCSYAGSDPAVTFTGTWTVDGQGTATLTGDTRFPLGSTCWVSEDAATDDDLVDASWAWGVPVVTATEDAPVTIASETVPAQATITNTAQRVWAGLQITKAYDGVDGAFADTTEVSGAWSCSYDGSPIAGGAGAWTLPATGGSVTVVAIADAVLPATAVCTVTENTLPVEALTDASYAWNAPVFAPNDPEVAAVGAVVTLSADEVGAATVTNSTRRVYASFDVVKSLVEGENVAAGDLDASLAFSGGYSCTLAGSPTVTGTWGPIAAGGRWSSPDILAGSICEVTTEDDRAAPVDGDPSFVWLAPDLGEAITVADGESPTITVTNTAVRLLSSFNVTKDVAGDVSGLVPDSRFGFQWQCVAGNGDVIPPASGTFTLADGEVWAAPNDVPVGANCTVSETDIADAAHPSYAWTTTTSVSVGGAVDGAVAAFQIPPADSDPVLVTVTNTLTRTPGTYAVTKTSDPATGSVVNPGDTVTYTVTITPGQVGFVDDVVVVDDMSGVLPYAAFDPLHVVRSQGGTTFAAGLLTWEVGRVEAGAPVTMEYTVQIDDDAAGVIIGNSVTANGELPPTDCDPCTTDHLTPQWSLAKTSDPGTGATVLPGQLVTYTLTATNTGPALVAGARAVDDLSGVLAHGDLEGELPDAVSVDGTTLTWMIPDLEPEQTATVSYTVRVHDDVAGETLRNVVVPEGPGGQCTTDCATEHPTPAWTLTKSSDPPSGSTVADGAVIAYTLEATNTSDAIVSGARAIDDLSGVLTDAVLEGAPPAGMTLAGTTLTWEIPDLTPGETATITYRVRIATGILGATVRNVVAPDGPGGTCLVCTTEHQVPPLGPLPLTEVPTAGGALPLTGGTPPTGWALSGVGLLLAGAVLLMIRRRRTGIDTHR